MDQTIVIPLVILLFLLALLIILCLLYKFVYKKFVAKQPAETLPFNYCKGYCCWNFAKENNTTCNGGATVAPVDEDPPIIVIKGGEPRKEDTVKGLEEGGSDEIIKETEPENKEQGTKIVPIRNEAIKEAEETGNNNMIKGEEQKNNIVEAANVEENNAINGVQERKQTAKSRNGAERRQAENYVILFTDGSEGSNRCGFGVYAGMDSSLNRCTVILEGEMSPYVAELQGMIQPLKELLLGEFRNISVVIGTDSLFTVIGLDWIQKGKTNYNASRKFNADLDLFYYQYHNYLQVLYALATCFEAVYVFYVPAHRNIAENEMADIFAKLSIFKGKNLWKILRKVCHINQKQLKRGRMDLTHQHVKYCEISGGELQLNLKQQVAHAILHQPMRQKYNVTGLETVIWQSIGAGRILDKDALMYHFMRGDSITWDQVLPR